MCAIIKRGILGGFSNKIGNIVGTSWKGIAVMKSLPLSVANPQTAGQVTQRSRFTAASVFGSQILADVVKPLNDRFAQQESGYNLFVRRNVMNAFDENGAILGNLSISQGKLDQVPNLVVTASAGTDRVTFTYTNNSGSGFALPDDEVYVVVYIQNVVLSGAMVTPETRSTGPAVWQSGGQLTQGMTLGYSFALRRADGSMVSTSQNGTVVVGA